MPIALLLRYWLFPSMGRSGKRVPIECATRFLF